MNGHTTQQIHPLYTFYKSRDLRSVYKLSENVFISISLEPLNFVIKYSNDITFQSNISDNKTHKLENFFFVVFIISYRRTLVTYPGTK